MQTFSGLSRSIYETMKIIILIGHYLSDALIKLYFMFYQQYETQITYQNQTGINEAKRPRSANTYDNNLLNSLDHYNHILAQLLGYSRS